MARSDRCSLRVPVLVAGTRVGTTFDLTRQGVGFSSSRQYTPGRQLELQIDGVGALRPVNMVVEVVWCKETADGDFRIGARLRAIGVKDSMVLSRFLGSAVQTGEWRAAS